ncbi:MAG: phosphoenolpyruvate hydrolase family protein [Clostridiales bacterium]|nr:phosphoenolpyruvate hydrolase family protein [Clostridiales bacterium]
MEKLNKQLEKKLHLVGVSCGSGLAAKMAIQGGADMILALSPGRFRQMGLGPLAGFMPYSNSNRLVMEFGVKEVVPKANGTPIIFGLNACDPTIILEQYLKQIKLSGFSGINNYPTIGLIDGLFREALEEQGFSFESEVEAIKQAHQMGMFTLAFVFDETQAIKMVEAGADIICAHLGLTPGGGIGAKHVMPLKSAADLAKRVFGACDEKKPGIIKMIYGGPVNTPMDLEFIYNNSSTNGYIGGSTFDRAPYEKAIVEKTREFKNTGTYAGWPHLNPPVSGIRDRGYVAAVKKYVSDHYMWGISFSGLADGLFISRSHLSSLFKKEMGLTFPEYLNGYRIHKARSLMINENITCSQAALAVGYKDYAHFCKTFKKIIGATPSEFMESNKIRR